MGQGAKKDLPAEAVEFIEKTMEQKESLIESLERFYLQNFYLNQLALGQFSKVEVSTKDDLKQSLLHVTQIRKELSWTSEQLSESKVHFGKVEAMMFEKLVEINTLFEAQATSLIALINAKFTEVGLEDAEADFEEKRSACREQLIDWPGFKEDLVK